jgi:hypothetical protein
MEHGKFGTAINCMDGRTQLPVIAWMKKNADVDYVDMITEPGPEGILASSEPQYSASIWRRVNISVSKHHSGVVMVVAHHDCAGNPVSKEKHLAHLKSAVEVVKSWNFSVRVVGAWVGEDWKVAIVSDTAPAKQ